LHTLACGSELGLAAHTLGGTRINARLVEQAEPELVPEETSSGGIDPLRCNAPVLDQRDDHFRNPLTAKLVATGVEIFAIRSSCKRFSTPHAFASQMEPSGSVMSETSPQSVQTTPSKP
jgi:hypothetical protein